MKRPPLFLLLNQSRNPFIAVGDTIEVAEAFGKDNLRVGLISTCRVNGRSLHYPLPMVYTKNFHWISPFQARITDLQKDGEDLVISVEAIRQTWMDLPPARPLTERFPNSNSGLALRSAPTSRKPRSN